MVASGEPPTVTHTRFPAVAKPSGGFPNGSRATTRCPRGSIRRTTPAAGLDTQIASGPAATDSAPWPTRTVVTTFLPSSSTRYRTPPYGSTAPAAPSETTSELRLIAGVALRRLRRGNRQAHLRRGALGSGHDPQRPFADRDRLRCSSREGLGWSGLAGGRVNARHRPIVGVQHPDGTLSGSHGAGRRPHPDRHANVVRRGIDRHYRVAGDRRRFPRRGGAPRGDAANHSHSGHDRNDAGDGPRATARD